MDVFPEKKKNSIPTYKFFKTKNDYRRRPNKILDRENLPHM